MSGEQNIYERRLVVRLEGYWNIIRGERKIPYFTKFNSAAVSDIWENCLCFTVDAKEKQNFYFCQYTGQNIKKAVGSDLKDRYIFLGTNELGREFIKALDLTVEKGEFTQSQGQFVNNKGKVVKYRDCVMPFTDQKDKISHLVVGVSWRAF